MRGMRVVPDYILAEQYAELVDKALRRSPPGLEEVWGVCECAGGKDFRLNHGKYRVIEISPLAKHLAVFMEWRRVYRNREIYERDDDFITFEEAHAHLTEDKDLHRPWRVWADTDIDEPQVEQFLESGMRLMVRELDRRHPRKGRG